MSSPSPTHLANEGSPMKQDGPDDAAAAAAEPSLQPQESSLTTPEFLPDQRVFCCEAGKYYEAIVRKTAWEGGRWKYLVHYIGWNARWDKFVFATDLWPDTPDSRQRVQAAQQQQEREEKEKQQQVLTASTNENRKRKKKAETPTSKGSSSKQPRKTLSSASSPRKTKTTASPPLAEYCELPFTLKTILIDDRERIERKGFDSPHGYDVPLPNIPWSPARQVHRLPASISIATVLEHFLTWKRKKDPSTEKSAREFCQDLAALFDAALPVCLLYAPERAQYTSLRARHPESSLAEIYGCEFLLRLIVRLPVLHQDSSCTMGPLLAELIVLLQKNRQVCFKPKYRAPTLEELHKWERTLQEATAEVGMDE